jgi:hypothetical protein
MCTSGNAAAAVPSFNALRRDILLPFVICPCSL